MIKDSDKGKSDFQETSPIPSTSEKWFRAIFEGSRDAIFLADQNAVFADVNQAACKLTGYTRDELLKMRIPDLHAPEDLHAYKTYFKRIIQGTDILSEADILSRQGEKIPAEFSNKMLCIDNKTYMLTIARDIRERRKTQENINIQSEAIEASMDGIAILDKNEAYLYMNEAHAGIYGYDSPDELLGRQWKILYDKEELEIFEKEIMPEFRKKGKWRGESIGRKKDGTRFCQEISLTALKNGGLVCVVRDITRQKENEKEKLNAQKTASEQEKLALVGKMAGKMAHDFNNILGVIMGNAEIALLDCPHDPTRKTLELIFEQTQRGRNLTRNLVAFAKGNKLR
ncbi:MAG: PAS domain S-box protein [Thermodesulfobacteriota bacterium]|nr:PAS domain S-box protein [Thermodesulfobacteriota bacterium]